MQVILLERIEKLGQMGDVVNVKPGFARNFLLPRKKALRATDTNLKRFSEQRSQLEASNLVRRQEAEAVAGKIEGLTVVLIRQAGETGQLYGSVSARDIAEAVIAGGVTIVRSQVLMDRPIKALGLHPVRVALHPEVIVRITANVARSDEDAAAQVRAGGFVPAATGETAPSVEELIAEADRAMSEEAAEATAETETVPDEAAEDAAPKAKKAKKSKKDETAESA
jgi:large subunit ribosomal protein L9